MENIKSLKSQLVLQFAIIILPMITILLYQTISDMYHSEGLAQSYHYLGACHDIKLKYTQFLNGAVDAVDTGQLGSGALQALDEAAEKLRNLAQEDHTRNLVKLQDKMDNVLTALRHDRAITTLMPLRELINQADAELENEYLYFEKENRKAIEANITFAKIQKKIVSGAIFFTLLLSLIVGRSITRSITRPITAAVVFAQSIILDSFTALAHGTIHLAQKDLTIPVKPKATGEVQVLVDSINRMAEDLGKRNRELIEAQEELVRSEKLAMFGLIAGNMGNELRNPLGVMNNAVYFLEAVLADADASVKEYLEIIRSEIDNSQLIIDELLDFFRDKPLRTKVILVNELIHQSLERSIIPVNIRLLADLPESLPSVRVDPLQMGQVFRNLIDNAVQAMPDGGSLRIRARKVQGSEVKNIEHRASNIEPEADFIVISVTDTGTGIAPENMTKLFQPLFTTKSRGIGLGLAISRKLIEANGGTIEAESSSGAGATFTMTLPVGGE